MQIEALITRYRNKKEREAVCFELFRLLHGRTMALCRKFLPDIEDAKDVMQDGFLTFFKELEKFEYRSEKETVGLLRRIIINLCINHKRKKKVPFEVGILDYSEECAVRPEVLQKYDAEEIYRFIAQLPDALNVIFNLYEIEELEHREIARLLNISEKTSYSQLSRAKSYLKKLIKRKSEDDENTSIQ